MLGLALVAFIAGFLTLLAPCIFTMLPIVLGYSTTGNIGKPLRVIAGLGLSVFAFSILLKATTLFLGVSTQTWQLISGGIILAFGIFTLFPNLWATIASKFQLEQLGARGSQKAISSSSSWSDYLLGASLGPVFSACSPTYGLIVATLLPVDIVQGVAYLLLFILGLSLGLLLITFGGQKAVQALNRSVDPRGAFKRVMGALFIVLGLLIITGLDRDILGFLIENGFYDWQVRLEEAIEF